ncbi:parB-like partition protein [Thermodesulfobacterium geofontis OPF15]|jgi:ParB family chromosome partitioning protein|uniref:ParB-like partition protein n=1 Tax=Thermodesulfobacterium geofontis (strain OPF15) TaxID=795359 RepID=F8C4N3_THEGP|nr:ParB/RepB/Spo0J family partition protein [Thermodesulfobacterium geofontis]AEH22700.1 parB-like partition protein [Thermodesulfobacterium geofontis OPF15]
MKKKALGKGLSELIPEIEESPIKYIPIDNILYSPFQPRIQFKEDEDFEELVKSIKERGILQPILVRKKGEDLYECVAGERRLKAAKKAGLKEVPAVIKNFTDEEVLLIALIENLQRKNLNPLEEALGYKNLIEKFGYTQEEIAEKVGKDRATVANLLRLLKLPSIIQEDLLEERLTVGHAKALLALDEEEKQIYVRNLILKKGLSVRETEKLVGRLQKGEISQKKKELDPDLVSLSEELSKIVGIPVQVVTKKKKTYFIFEFNELEKAENFIEKLKKVFTV